MTFRGRFGYETRTSAARGPRTATFRLSPGGSHERTAVIVQGLLAAGFLVAGAMKFSQPKQKLVEMMGWPADFSENTVKGIGVAELLAAIGLILPAATGIATWLTPLAAVGLALLMIGAMATHYRRKEPQMIVTNVVIFALALLVAWGRFGPYSF
jgi:uncharacterized membrane protein